MGRKKQDVLFKGVTKQGQMLFTPNFEGAVALFVQDPIPVNRKSTRAMLKLIQGMQNDQEQENPEADRIQKQKRKKKRKASYLSRRFNRIRKRAS